MKQIDIKNEPEKTVEERNPAHDGKSKTKLERHFLLRLRMGTGQCPPLEDR